MYYLLAYSSFVFFESRSRFLKNEFHLFWDFRKITYFFLYFWKKTLEMPKDTPKYLSKSQKLILKKIENAQKSCFSYFFRFYQRKIHLKKETQHKKLPTTKSELSSPNVTRHQWVKKRMMSMIAPPCSLCNKKLSMGTFAWKVFGVDINLTFFDHLEWARLF